MSGIWFGAVCVTFTLMALALFAAWTLDRRRRYIALFAPTPLLAAVSLVIQAVPHVWIGWRVGISGLLTIAAALLTWEALTSRRGLNLGRSYRIEVVGATAISLFAGTVVLESPVWTLHFVDVIIAMTGIVGVFKARMFAGLRRGDGVIGATFILFGIVFAIRSWVGLDIATLNRGQGPDLGGWSPWVNISFALLGLVICGGFVGQEIRDIVDNLQIERNLDPLTGLMNRRGFETSVASTGTTGTRFNALIISDLDQFKDINDILGHAAGDRVLSKYGALVRDHGRAGILGRIGGEEFAIFLTGTTGAEARDIAECLRLALSATQFDFQDRRVQVTISTGIAVAEPGVPYEDLFQAADRCLYQAKKTGRNRTWPEIPTLRSVDA